jgi:hypothetical protein
VASDAKVKVLVDAAIDVGQGNYKAVDHGLFGVGLC